MKTGRKLTAVLCSVLLVLTSLPVTVQAVAGDYRYTVKSDRTSRITAYFGSASELILPETLDGYPVSEIGMGAFSYLDCLRSVVIPDRVTAIADSAFASCANLTAVAFPESLTGIGSFAFYNCGRLREAALPSGVTAIGFSAFEECGSLESVDLPDSLLTIGMSAFRSCADLRSVDIPAGVTFIGEGAFFACSRLEEFRVDSRNPFYFSDEYGVLFNKEKTTLLQYPIGSARTEYVIPFGTEEIGSFAFGGCDSLKSVTIPDSILSVADRAFADCTDLLSLVLPDSVTEVGDSAFAGCKNLRSVEIGKSVLSIGDDAFSACQRLERIRVDGQNPAYSSDSYGVLFNKEKTALLQFPENSEQWKYTVPSTVTEIGYGAFRSCRTLRLLVLTSSVKGIDAYAFDQLDGLKKVSFVGTPEQWKEMIILFGNDALGDAELIFTDSLPEEHLTEPGTRPPEEHLTTPSTEPLPATDADPKPSDTASTEPGDDPMGSAGDPQQTDMEPSESNIGLSETTVVPPQDGTHLTTREDRPIDTEPQIPFGDVNGDGKVNSSDARLALRAAVGLEDLTEVQKAAADVNRDGNVRSSDARKILRVAVGLDTFNEASGS